MDAKNLLAIEDFCKAIGCITLRDKVFADALHDRHDGKFSEAELEFYKKDQSWRSDLETFRDRLWCKKCDQQAGLEMCSECFSPLTSDLPSLIDAIPPVNSICQQSFLRSTADVLLQQSVDPEIVIEVLRKINNLQVRPAFPDEEIENLFRDACHREANRRGAL